MPTVSEMLTSFNGPNFHGALHLTTRPETPFATALMGTAEGGGQAVVNSRQFEWQTYDLRAAAQNTVPDGDTAGTGEHRSRQNVFNVIETHREDINVAWEKQSQFGQFDGQNISGQPIVTDEESFQTQAMWKQVKRDIDYSLINGSYVNPADNNTAAQTRGILEAITTNAFESLEDGQSATGEDIDDLVDLTGHGYVDGQDVTFSALTGGANLAVDTRYYVINATANTFQLAATKGGAAIDFGSDITASTIHAYGEPNEESVGDLMQSAYDNGGLIESSMGLLLVNSGLKRWLTKIFVKDKNLELRTRSVGGANVQTVETDFGELGIMLEPHIPQGTLATVSLDQCKPHFRFIEGKGVAFVSPIGADGARDRLQLYTSIGLEYGNEAAHAKDTGFTANAPAAA